MDVNDIVGRRFGRLIVVSFAETKRHAGPSGKSTYHLYNIRCDCGAEKRAHRVSLLIGRTVSCGCRRRAGHQNAMNRVFPAHRVKQARQRNKLGGSE
jgi:hypothetical protein